MAIVRDNDGGNLVRGTANADTIFGNGGNDEIFGGRTTEQFDFETLTGNDIIDGGKGGDTSHGMDGDDVFVASAGGDTAYGGTGFNSADYRAVSSGIDISINSNIGGSGGAAGDFLYGIQRVWGTRRDDDIFGAENSTTSLFGGRGSDDLTGGDAADYVYGGAGGDFLRGSAGDSSFDEADFLYGGKGADAASGGAGDDQIVGGSGGDSLFGNDGQDSLSGGTGADVLGGNDGSNRLSGGGGADEFQFFTFDTGIDVVTDFNGLGGDTILLITQGTFDSFADIQGAATDTDAGVVIALRFEHTILLQGVEKADLRAAWFEISS